MKPPRICPDCGANLDAQERCTCHDQDDVNNLKAELEKKSDALQEQIRAGIRKDAEIRRLNAELEAAKAELGRGMSAVGYAAWLDWHTRNDLEKQMLRERVEAAEAEIRRVGYFLAIHGFSGYSIVEREVSPM
jgi:DNA repair exonuclease SbcCD ATPase subunit